MKTFKVVFCVLITVTMATFSACTSEDGDWESMKWNTNADMVRKSDEWHLKVSEDGGTFRFSCENYGSFWFAGIEEMNDGKRTTYYPQQEDYKHIISSWAEMKIENNELIVTIRPNDKSMERTLKLTVQAGDIFSSFGFYQVAGK